MVTGGAGFIGAALVERLLAEGHEVDVVDDLSAGSLPNLAAARALAGRSLTIHQLDLREPDLVQLMARRRPRLVYHLAAQTRPDVALEQPALDAAVNVVGSVHVLEGARAAGSERVVFAAAARSLYGDPDPSSLPLRESEVRRPLGPAGASQAAVLAYLSAYRDLYALEFVALALANVYGPRQGADGSPGVVAAFAERLVRGKPVTIHGNGRQTRDFVFVDDAVDAFVRAGSRGGGLVCNVGTGQAVSVLDLHRRMVALAGSDAEAVFAPARPADPAHVVLDPGRAAIQLGWHPWTELDDGLASVVEAARARVPPG
jgi:UDP-glucose 4-epimerase